MFKIQKEYQKIIVKFLFFIFFIIGLFSVKDYGISYDELEYRHQGFVVLNDLGKKFLPNTSKKIIDDRGLNFISTEKYFESSTNNARIQHTIYAFLEFLFFKNSEKYTVFKFRHYLNFIMSFCLILIVYKILRFNFNRTISIIGCLAFVLSPRIFANFFYNPNDIWSAFSLATCLYFLLKLLKKNDIKYIVFFSTALAATINIRYVNIYIYPLFFLFLVLNHKKDIPLLLKNIFFHIISFVIFLFIFTVDLWINPSQILLKIFGQSNWNEVNPKIMFDGKLIFSSDIPWYYLIKWFAMTTPIVFLFFGILGILFSLFKFSFKEIVYKKTLVQQCNLILLFLFLLPLIVFIINKPALHNDWRHFYFIYVFFIYFFCLGIHIIYYRFGSRSIKNLLSISILISFIIQIFWMIKNHPYQNVYFNSFSKSGARNFELDYWGLSNLESLKYLINHAYTGTPLTVSNFNDGSRIYFAYLMLNADERKKIKLVKFDTEVNHFYITNINNGLNKKDYESLGLVIYHQIIVDGIVINEILLKK